jgi:hypothetical protein
VSSAQATVDLDDTEGLLEADRDGFLRASAQAGAQVRATAAAVDEGALESITGGQRPRTVIWVGARGAAEAAGAMLTAALSGSAAEPLVILSDSPPWVGPLDVLVAAGDDPSDPVLVTAAATAARRGARVVVAAPYEGPLREATAGRAAVLAPRVSVPEEFGLCRYLAVGLATLAAVDPAVSTDLAALADELDAEALRNSAGRELFTNPAKALAERMAGRATALAGDCAATLALARHAAAVLLRVAGHAVAAAGLADTVVAMRSGRGTASGGFDDPVQALFHDAEIDGPLPARPRLLALVLALAAERQLLTARLSGISDLDLVGVADVGDAGTIPAAGRPEQQLATLALRLEMSAVYLRLAGG